MQYNRFPVQSRKGCFGKSDTQKMQFHKSQAIPSVKSSTTVKQENNPQLLWQAWLAQTGASGSCGQRTALPTARLPSSHSYPQLRLCEMQGEHEPPLRETHQRSATGRWRPLIATIGPQTLLPYRAPPKGPRPLFQVDFSIVPCVGPSGAAQKSGLDAFPWEDTLSQDAVTNQAPWANIHIFSRKEGSCPQLKLIQTAQVLCSPP